MSANSATAAYFREQDAPHLPPPPSTVGVQGWLLKNLFSSVWYSILTIVFAALLLWIVWDIVNWAIFTAAWTGTDREACSAAGTGACWPMVFAKFPQWIYGFYPIGERWRVNVCFIVAVAALAPMLMPSMPHKKWNALFLLMVFPIVTLILLTGGNFNFGWGTYAAVLCMLFLFANAVPLSAFGIEEGVTRNITGLGLAGAALMLWLVSFTFVSPRMDIAGLSTGVTSVLVATLLAGSAAVSITAGLAGGDPAARAGLKAWVIAAAGIVCAMLVLDIDFGLVPVDTSEWGGLTVTLVVSVTGIAASLPIGILLALGRRSNMPAVRIFSVVFIELWRGVPLITVLFMSSVMLPLFLPAGTSFDKLLRALIGVGLFSAAYMAEVVRSGLQAIPNGQYEGAQALGLSYWQIMGKIILPQALKISIPNIVGNFISLFKDTTLVAIIGLFDLLGIVRAGLKDTTWASQSSAPTGYFALALMFWVFCFGMSRYSIYTERRLQTGHKR